jgi:hypothetical protein
MQLNKVTPTKSAHALAPVKGISKRGRKATTLTDEQKENLFNALESGLPMTLAADYIGEAPATLRAIIKRTPSLAKEACRIQSCFIKSELEGLNKAGARSWQSYAWKLERLHWPIFGQRRIEPERVQTTNNIIQVFQGKPSDKPKQVHSVDCD